MKNAVHILTMIFCLGIFLIPKQNFYAQNTETEKCCTSSSEKSDCCKDQKKNPEKGCQENCCSACHTCNTFISFPLAKAEKLNTEFKKDFFKKSSFVYKSPSFSFYLKEIWQPPKIG